MYVLLHICATSLQGALAFLLILSLTSVRTPWTTLYVQNYSAFRVSVPLPYSAYRSLQSGLIGPISIDRVEKKSQCSLPDAHCFMLQCLFRCKSVGKSVTSCLCMEGGSLSQLKRKLAKEDCGLGNVWDRMLYCSLSDIISFPPRLGILAAPHLPLHSTPLYVLSSCC